METHASTISFHKKKKKIEYRIEFKSCRIKDYNKNPRTSFSF